MVDNNRKYSDNHDEHVSFGLERRDDILWNLCPAELYEQAILNREAKLTKDMALCILTGKYTGRSPMDRFIVEEPSVQEQIDWGEVNKPISSGIFDSLYTKMADYLQDRKLYVKDLYAGADPTYRLSVRVISEAAYHSLFAHNMFIRPDKEQLALHKPDFTVIAAPHFQADPEQDGTRSGTFIFISFERRLILIGGTLYSGEIKKGIFSVLNYLLPQQDVISMHCSANMDVEGNTALFFGLSGTGKTTLSSDPDRILIGDDEHGWSDDGIFNIEGGCYAKTIDLSKKEEPLIYTTTQRPGTILENVVLNENREPEFGDGSLTENTRCAYPIHFIPNASSTGIGGHPNHILFLTADAFGILPPIACLTPEQAMYHFISGYTSKIPGTERNVTEPQATFSACFGSPFIPLHPSVYAGLLAEKIRKHNTNVWLVNTGWIGGAYGQGRRMELHHTRKILSEALNGHLDQNDIIVEPVFGLQIPKKVENISSDILIPRNSWADPQAYNKAAQKLARMFRENFKRFEDKINNKLNAAGPNI